MMAKDGVQVREVCLALSGSSGPLLLVVQCTSYRQQEAMVLALLTHGILALKEI